jgi:hypothetical protein
MGLDNSLIKKFRDKVNENDFTFYKYQNYEGKDKWSCICSAMDWITIAVDFINSDWDNSKNINIKCMNLYTYISSIDVLWEAIQQLHRVFLDTAEIPFRDENMCFESKITEEEDNDYFKTIRACFGAHPINIKLKENKQIRWFASWPFEGRYFWSEKDFKVRLYNNQQEKEELSLGINISELNNFVLRRYEYLLELMKEIEKQYKQFIRRLKERKINTYEDIFKQLNELKIESHKRLCDKHASIIEDIECVFQVKSNNKSNEKILDLYKEKLLDLVKEIYITLQDMKFCNLDKEYIISPKSPPELYYPLEKLSSAMWSGTQLYAFTPIKKHLEGIIDFDSVESIKERYVLTLAGLYIKSHLNES